MKFKNAFLSTRHLWFSPFVRWQGSLADVSSMDLAVAVTHDALAQRQFDLSAVSQLVMGTTIPQAGSFYAVPWLAARLGMEGVSGPHISQACATSVACLVAAASAVEVDQKLLSLVVLTDRTSNGPLIIYPRSQGMGGSPATEHWLLDNMAADPWTGQSMVATAEAVARDGKMQRSDLDELTLLRYAQYQRSLTTKRSNMQAVVIQKGKKRLVVEMDEGVHPYTAEGLAALKPVLPEGVVTHGSQTHPADGAAGAIVCGAARARELSQGEGVVRLIAAGFARAEKGRMPKAATLAAQSALDAAGLSIDAVKVVTTHNPFAVNDLWFTQQTGFALERMNPYGSSLIYGHPQGPTGMRAIAELVEALRASGGGIGLFTGCAAGDTGAAIVLEVE